MELTEGIKDFIVAVTDLVYARVRELLARDAPPRAYTYIGGLESDAPGYAGGARGTAIWAPPIPRGSRIKIIDLIAVGDRIENFILDELTLGGETLLNGSQVPAAVFAPGVLNRGFETHPHTVGSAAPLVAKFHSVSDSPEPRAFWLAVKVQSDVAPSTDLPKGDLT